MARVNSLFFILIAIQFVFVTKSEDSSANSTRKERSFSDSLEIMEFSDDRYTPRFYLNRPKNRFSHFQSQFYNDNRKFDNIVNDRLYETESSSSRPLTWQDFPQLINNKLSSSNIYSDVPTTPPYASSYERNSSLMANYSQIVPKFPIYFTNPATGVVYAITEVSNPDKLLDNYTASGGFSAGSTKSYDDGKYVLQCTMVDALSKPTKKTLLPTSLGPSNSPQKRKKSKKNSTKRRTTTATKTPQTSPFVGLNGNTINNVNKPKQNLTRLVSKVTKLVHQPTTRAPSSSVFSSKRKITKRMVPPTAPTNLIPSPSTTRKTRPTDEDSYDDDSDDDSYDESYYDNSISAEKKKQKRIKRHENGSNAAAAPIRVNGSFNDEDDSTSNEDYEDYDYMSQIMSPFQDVFETMTQKAAGILTSSKEDDTEVENKPQYTMFGTDLSNGNNVLGNSWLGSWFYSNKQKSKNDQLIVSSTPPTKGSGWFDDWYGDYDENVKATESSQEDDKKGSRWLFNWFSSNTNTVTKKTTTTTTTTTSTTTTQAPFLSYINPIKNPPDWFGILAQNLINKTPIQKSTTSPYLQEESKKVSYDGYQIWRLHLKDQSEVKFIEKYKHSNEGAKLQWLKGPSSRGPTDIIVPPKLATDFLGTLNYEGIQRDILIFDLGKAIKYDNVSKTVVDLHQKNNRFPISWKNYYRYEDIIRFMEYIQMKHPQFVELIHIGRTFEGRPVIIAKIGRKQRSQNAAKKKSKKQKKQNKDMKEVFIEAGAHGREWIGPAAATWIIRELIKIHRSNSSSHDTIKNSSWYVLPVLNPDGYEYAHEFDRFWRKTRSKHISKPSGILNSAMAWIQQDKQEKICYGVDLNRNWEVNWGKKGSSKSPCNEFYAGPNAFSEPEVRALANFLMDRRKNIKLFVSLHSYGQIISYPNNISTTLGPYRVDDLMEVALMGMESMRTSGSTSRYRINAGNDMKAIPSGTSDYYAAYGVGIPFSYTIDLSDDGVHGFLLPGSFIEPTSKDAFEMIKAMLDYID